jgi:predicted nucleic acid-binding protein
LAGAQIVHCAVALGEIAAGIGLLDPGHPGTPKVSRILSETLRRADPTRIVAPSSDAWLEASLIAGVLARTQHLPKDSRRKLLNDALVFLTAAESQAVLVSRNGKDVDLLLRLRPDVPVFLYDAEP